jgi:hypothetical protein
LRGASREIVRMLGLVGVPRGALKFFFFVLGYLGCAAFVFWLVAPRWGFPPAQVGRIGHVTWVAFVSAFIAKLWWLYVAWTAIPKTCRLTAQGEAIAPEDAAVKHLVPTSAVFWQFKAHVGLAEATNAVLASYDTKAEASTRIPFLACCLFFLPGVNLAFFVGLLFLHMRDVDSAHVEMARCLTSAQHVRGYVPPQPPTMLSMAKLIAFASLLTWIPLPWAFIALVDWTSAPRREVAAKKEANGPVKTPQRVHFHADRIAEEMAACARLDGNTVPAFFERCPNVELELKVARIEGDAVYTWEAGTLTAWTPGVRRVYTQRHVSCTTDTCSWKPEPFGADTGLLARSAPPMPPRVEQELDAVAKLLTTCAKSKHGVPDNLYDCPEAEKRLTALNAEKGEAIFIYATPKLTAWTPTYGHAYGRRLIKCSAGACSFEPLPGE